MKGACWIGEGAEIGPDTMLTDTTVGERAEVRTCVATGATIGDRARIGPFVTISPGVVVPEGAVIGPFTSLD